MQLKPAGTFLPFNSGALQARIYRDTGHIELAGPDMAGNAPANIITFAPPTAMLQNGAQDVGRVISSQPLLNGLQLVQTLGNAQITARLTFPHDSVMRYEVTDWRGAQARSVSITCASDGSEHFYGFGEKFNALDQAGKSVRILSFDNPGPKGDHSYKVAPWFLSTRGYGLHLDSTAESVFDMRATAADRYTVTNLSSTLGFNVVYGPRLPDVLSRYTGYTGRPPLSPPWVFGTWISSDIWRNGGEIRYAVDKFLAQGIPASVFVFDSPWETAYNDFAFNMTQFGQGGTFEGTHFDGFASLAEMMEFFCSRGLKVVCWMTPLINTSSDDEQVAGQNLGKSSNYDSGANQNFYARSSPGGPPLVVKWWKGSGSPVDFTNPAIEGSSNSGLHFLIYPDGESDFTVFDGTHVRCQARAGGITITLNSVARLIRLQIFGNQPVAVQHDGAVLNQLPTRAAFDAAGEGWWQDSANDFTFVKFQHVGGVTRVSL